MIVQDRNRNVMEEEMSMSGHFMKKLMAFVVGLLLVSACQNEQSTPGASLETGKIATLGSKLSTPVATAPRVSHRTKDANLIPAVKRDGTRTDFEPGVVLVSFKEQWRDRMDQRALSDMGLRLARRTPMGVDKMKIATKESVLDVVKRLNQDPRVRYAEPNHRIELENVPNDPSFGDCWGMNNTGQTGGVEDADIDAVEAWDISIGSRDVVVAVLDTGVDYTHPDLAANMWTNVDEIPDNGIDDDNNGYVDDVIGWDFEHQTNDPMDDYGHGTHCSGIIGAEGNNGIGVVGVNWRVTIMPLRIIGNQDLDAYCLDAAEAIHYAVDNGARLMSCSWWTVEHYNQTLEEAVQYADQMDVALVAAAGNDSRDDDDPNYNHWPSEWPYDNIFAVAATNHSDGIAYFSNFGPTSVDVGAPGEDILSTVWPNHAYETMSGTSMACPHVAGTVALMLSIRPELTIAEVKQALFATVDPIPDLQGVTVTGGRINAFRALQAISGVPLPPVALAGGDQTVMTGTTVTLDGSNSFDPNGDPITYAWEFYPPDHSSAAIDDDTIAAPQFLADVCGMYQANLTVTDDGGLESPPDRARVNVMNYSDQDPVIETDHPYAANEDRTWEITIPGSVVIGVHFASFDTESRYDFVHILDGDDNEWAVYDGAMGEFNSVTVEGNTIKIHFTSDSGVQKEGFVIDGVWWCDAGNCPPGQGDCNDDPSDGCETDTSSNTENCGWCGHVCSFANASAQCTNSVCELVSCIGGFEDCDMEVGNGCESDPMTDPDNCGGCGTVCGPYDHATAGCENGSCAIAECEMGWDDCNGVLSDGCETPVAADPDNCGGCGVVCDLDHATASYCENSTCQVGDCTVSIENIETDHPYSNSQDLTWQITHSGASGISVHFSMFNTERNYDYVQLLDGSNNMIVQYWGNMGEFTSEIIPGDTVNIVFHSDSSVNYDGFVIDSSRYCVGTGCESGWGDCDGEGSNGCETDTLTDLNNCGGCGDICGAPNTNGTCSGGTCTTSDQCLDGFGDCNSDMSDGCEVDLNTDVDNCGGCATPCADVYPNAQVGCESGSCTMGECNVGFDDCDGDPSNGCEVSVLTDPQNCGGCGAECVLPHVGSSYCADGECQIGDCQVFVESVETSHPYDNNQDLEWTIEHQGVTAIEIHFAQFDLENNYDHVTIFDSQNNQVAQYTGNLGPFVTDPIPGDSVRISFHSDSSVTHAGFIIDWTRACSGTGCETGWDDCDTDPATGCESDLSSDPDNCGACGLMCLFQHATGDCVNSTCTITSCDTDWDDCNTDGMDGCEADLNNDLANCGGCGNSCEDTFPNAQVTCNSGMCEMGNCLPGYGDCNNDTSDGCETDLNSDPAHCSACGQACSLDHATAGCEAGSCTVASCDTGWGDCNSVASDGCEQNVQDDDSNCGGCGVTCDVSHATASCSGVTCVISACDDGWGDCDGNERNGCESMFAIDVDNCGGCGTVCEFANAAASCEAGQCVMGDCELNSNDCNEDPSDGCESNPMEDVDNCGRCGIVCSTNHADSQCINGTCFMGDCEEGYANCNYNNADGCEVNITADVDNCGECGLVCEIDHATAACADSECVVSQCEQGWGDCDGEGFNGCESELSSDPNNCGTCGGACELAHGTSSCANGSCVLEECDNGFDDCNQDDSDGCEVDKLSDVNNCGHCGIQCPSGQSCEMGVCVCADADSDGHEDVACGGDDCDDSNADIYPGADETCDDQIDNDCDGHTDEGCEEPDTGDTTGGGCGCASGAPGSSASGLLWLGLLGLALIRKRRN